MQLDEAFDAVDADLIERLQKAEAEKSYDTVTHALLVLNRALIARAELVATLQGELQTQIMKANRRALRESGAAAEAAQRRAQVMEAMMIDFLAKQTGG